MCAYYHYRRTRLRNRRERVHENAVDINLQFSCPTPSAGQGTKSCRHGSGGKFERRVDRDIFLPRSRISLRA